MPHSAIATGAVDFVLPPAGIAEELGRIGSHPYLTVPPEALEESTATTEQDGELQTILDILKSATKIDFAQYKQSTIRRRIGRRLVVHHLGALGEYLEYLRADPAEIHNLYRDILISVTSFFREPEMFQVLSEAISHYFENRPDKESSFRLWVPGCATGEEVYSLAITVWEVFESSGTEIPFKCSVRISVKARRQGAFGLYSEKIEQDISPHRLRRFFFRVDSGFRINQRVRENCVFARHDLTSDPPFSQMDLVSCRNVFIYI